MNPRIRCALLAGLTATACAAPQRRSAAADSVSFPAALSHTDTSQGVHTPPACALVPPDSARLRYWAIAGSMGYARSEAIAKLGAPVAAIGDTVRNQANPAVLDSLVTLQYRSLSLRFYVRASGGELPAYVSVTDSSVRLPLPIGVGATRADLTRCFGRPDYEGLQGDSLQIQFDIPDGALQPNGLMFMLVNGTVRRVEWAYGLD